MTTWISCAACSPSDGVSATSIRAACNGFGSIGIKTNEAFGITENLMDAKSLFLTPNTTTVYGFTCFDLSKGPMVLEVPTGILAPLMTPISDGERSG